ncbi:hypothetical protein FSP39_021960 [Pinctada imbricata]|uniref:Uncharacterized protein n=1 Tax=Pinctada imbricata TaxID=66713 RepID=A0AA89BXV3_PINIB|nr:hypothetical protein FSP39_021960 [Pinctada imbricata]
MEQEISFERQAISAPSSRSASFKKKGKRLAECAHIARSNSESEALNCHSGNAKAKQIHDVRRVRSFKTTKKGVVNKGDLVSSRSSFSSAGSLRQRRERSRSDDSDSSSMSCDSCFSNFNNGYYTVAVYGAPSVGKKSIVNQFMTSEYIGGYDPMLDQLEGESQVSVLLDGEESTLMFCDNLEHQSQLAQIQADAFIVVFSIDDEESFYVAKDTIGYLRNEMDSDRTIILVANKVDLVRRRHISQDDARCVASDYHCKYIETSATLNHHVDELLVGVLRQIRLLLDPDVSFQARYRILKEERDNHRSKKSKGFLSRLFRKNVQDVYKCENLFQI